MDRVTFFYAIAHFADLYVHSDLEEDYVRIPSQKRTQALAQARRSPSGSNLPSSLCRLPHCRARGAAPLLRTHAYMLRSPIGRRVSVLSFAIEGSRRRCASEAAPLVSDAPPALTAATKVWVTRSAAAHL